MELSVGVSFRQLLIQLYDSSSCEALCHPGVTSLNALLTLTNDKLCARLRLVGYKMLLCCQVTVTVDVLVWKFGHPSGKSASRYRLSSYGHRPRFSCSIVYTCHIINQMFGQKYSIIDSQAHLMEFGADPTIDYIGQSSTIVHSHVVIVLEAPDLKARIALCKSLVLNFYRVVYSADRFECLAQGERVHLWAKSDELEDWISFNLVFEVANLFGVSVASTSM